jgi:signal peptidase
LGEGWKEYLKYFIFFIVLAAIALGGIQVLKMTMKTKYPIMVVVSQSMVPTLGVGDFILVGQITNFDEVEAAPSPEGDILVFMKTGSNSEYIVHRAIDKTKLNDQWYYVTKGDNNAVRDSHPTPESRVMGKVVGRIPILGYFPLFIKTTRGFALVAVLMGIIFFADTVMPKKWEGDIGGSFPWFSLIPFLIAPLVILFFLFNPNTHLRLELFALASWYVGCFVAPLAFEDDDMGLMFWLYHFVLVIIPLGSDIVWWTTRITPSSWWATQGSTVPITWLLQRETASFYRAFMSFASLILPGSAIFLLLVAAKRQGLLSLISFSKKIRGERK